ncbi:uncharacterized protein [Palaemon carinicauda]|uniref:uncharacterized protein isoform X3 n=1 Tax=Palaemon carinicauda TaxID=392227 RepID=UPI0035B69AC0
MKLLLLCLFVGVIVVSALAVPTGLSDSTAGKPDLSCEGDGRYRFRCNWCRCVEGRSLCTKRGCPPGLAERLEGEPECEGNVSFKRDCNTCSCVGKRAICTTKFCGPLESPSEISVTVTKEIQTRSTDAELKCTAGSRWRVDCNWCTCNELGQGICTKKGCPSEPTEEEEEEPQCEGTSRWKQDCNWCNCVDGRGICTLKACGEDVALPPQDDVSVSYPSLNPKPSDDEVLCTNGSRFRDECNWCSCGEAGIPSCTLISCVPELIEASKNEPMCIGNSQWKIDCNWCNCANGKAVCTLKECLPGVDTQESEEVCTNGSRWREDCNWCHCNNGAGLCTKRLCPEGLPEQADEPECEGNSRWKRDCNWCNCVEGRAICTEIACTQGVDTRESQDVCTNGSRWKENCNWCRCNNGVGLCTKRLCPEGLPEQADEPECEGNSRWKRDCNWCNCVEGRAICTEIACTQGIDTREFEEVCTNGSRWKENCNWCRCINGLVLCTKRLCPEGIPEADEPECEGNSRWKRDCNWCNCVEGRAICTEIACTQGVDTRESQEVCTNGSRWKENCNWCRCNNGAGLCTRRLCPEGLPEQADEPECEGNSRWKRDCNWCNCVEGRAICTEIACTQGIDTREFEEVCTNGSRWKENCNWCRCNNGLGLCTKRLCPEGIPEQTDEPECEGNSRWKRDCNWCNCVEGRAICTEIACTQGSASGACVEGISWNDGCNTCVCSEGLIICTQAICPDVVEIQVQCEEGSSWKEDCNTCHCSNGLPMCTKMSCSVPQHCLLPAIKNDGPLCEGFFHMWTFDSATHQCKSIVYGGCGGTDNLFESESDCVTSCVMPGNRGIGSGQQIEEDEACARSQCPWKRWAHYLAKGCLPQYDGGACCPTRFLCASYYEAQGNKSHCLYRNKIYEIGESLEVADDCSASCRCTESSTSESPEIVCASVECPDLFRPHPMGCRPLYRLGKCCSYDYDCADSQSPAGLETRSQTCFWNNRTYHEGDKMYFDEFPCQRCICGSEFSDPFGPGCVKIDCGFEFRYAAKYERDCVPIFFKENCCPIDWLCPDDSRIVEDLGQDTKEEEVNACILDKDPGSCYHDVTRIYYDAEASECRQFVYGGCQGNRNNFRSFEECEESCSKTPRPSQSECQIGGKESTGPSKPQNVKVTALLNLGHPGRMSLQVEWSPPKCPRGNIKGYQVWVQALGPKDKPLLDKSTASKFTGPLITQLVSGGLYLEQSYIIAVAAENEQKLGDISPLVVFSLIPNYRRPDQCHLGSISLEVGKSVQLSNCEIDCRCITPPEFTCVRLDTCDAVREKQSYKDCSEISCDIGCTPLTDTLSGCLTCSCKNESFTCPELQCPPSCGSTIDYETGCPKCSCQCPFDSTTQSPCPEVCTVIQDSVTGCPVLCECDPEGFSFSNFQNCSEDFHCPENCTIHIPIDSEIACARCECDSNTYDGSSSRITRRQARCSQNPPCPQDCAIKREVDQNTGCLVCRCDPQNPGNPFITHPLPPNPVNPFIIQPYPYPRRQKRYPSCRPLCPQDCATRYTIDRHSGCLICTCIQNGRNPFAPIRFPHPHLTRRCSLGPDARPPCPQDCSVIETVDKNTGCPICICDPNGTGNPFGPVNPPPPPTRSCPVYPEGKPPCPQDCGVIQTVDKNTGCPICICDPNDTGNPFGPINPPPPPTRSCPVYPEGKPPCPQDCGVIQTVNKITGCPICICDPNDTGNPFGPINPPPPPTRSCPVYPEGKPPCPQDCGVIQTVDKITGCPICICDPNDTGNPFGPINPPPFPTRSCPVYPEGKPPCPQDCGVIQTVDKIIGCPICICDPNDTGNPFGPINPPPLPTRSCPVYPEGKPPCPQDCGVIQTVDKITGCPICICDPNDTGNPFGPINPPPLPTRSCPVYPEGKPPCPQDCGVIQTVDKITGCPICICDPNDTGNPFGPINPPPLPTRSCPVYPEGKPPCPQDCGVIQTVDKISGCPICICDPNDTGNPFGPINPPPLPTRSCPVYPEGKPPCPQDCGVIQTVDKITGCPICICDPNDTGNPFGPINPPPLPTRSCPVYPEGKPPCPQDCGVIQTVDKITGCPICICDPNDTGNPFGPVKPPTPPTRSCPVYPEGKPPCPQDCGVIQTVDKITGCQICICDPNDTGNPFGPINPPTPPIRSFL